MLIRLFSLWEMAGEWKLIRLFCLLIIGDCRLIILFYFKEMSGSCKLISSVYSFEDYHSNS